MSKIGDLLTGAVISTAVGVASELVNALLVSGRSIGGIIPQVTIEEHHEDELVITEQPVQQGAEITDHAYKKPSRVSMRIAWGNDATLVRSIVSGSLLQGETVNANDMYRQLLDLQASRQVFDVVTGKRTYNNMLISMIRNTTDADTENCVVLDVTLRQINIVQTSDVALAPTDDQEFPEDTASVVDAGTKQPLRAAKQSALNALFGD